MADLSAAHKRRRPHVMVIAADRSSARWAQALAAERVLCLVANDLTVAARLLVEEQQQLELLIIDRALLERQPRALLNMLRDTGHWPVMVPIKSSPQRPTVADRKRVAAALSLIRPKRPNDRRIRIGEMVIDPHRRRARLKKPRWVALPPVQYQLLFVLAQHAGKVVGYQQLLREVWGYDGSQSEAQDLLKAHIRLLRRKLGLNAQGEYIQSVRGHGYMLDAPEGN